MDGLWQPVCLISDTMIIKINNLKHIFELFLAVLSVSYWIYNSLYRLKLKRHFCHNLTSPVFPHVLVLSLYLAVEYSQLACSIFPLRMPISLDTMSSRAWSSFWILFNFTASAWVCLDLWKVTNCLINLILLPQCWSSGHNNMLLNTEPRQPYLLLRNSFCQQSFLAPIPLFDYLLLLLQLLQTRLLPSVIRHGEDPRFTVSVTSHCFSFIIRLHLDSKASNNPVCVLRDSIHYGLLSSKSYFCDLIDVYSLHKTIKSLSGAKSKFISNICADCTMYCCQKWLEVSIQADCRSVRLSNMSSWCSWFMGKIMFSYSFLISFYKWG